MEIGTKTRGLEAELTKVKNYGQQVGTAAPAKYSKWVET